MERIHSTNVHLRKAQNQKLSALNDFYKQVHETLLVYQSHTLGLFPRGISQHARVRDNVYCAMALWALSKSYSCVGWDYGRSYELEQSAVKCMRGILFCYMRQSDKVEQFKKRRMWKNALHSRYDYITGDPVTDDASWGHLQIDGTSLFLLVLAQMIASGVQVIYSKDEVDFVQNLVFYIERAYRTPDFGMWECETNACVSSQELHASSIGMAKAALDAIHGLNLFGNRGPSLLTIHVDPDAQYRNHVILSTLLPKESSSKETDSALLCITGFPAFCIKDEALCAETEERVTNTLEGRYGFKRFLKDGHHTVKEHLSSGPMDLEMYEGIECEWPLFYIYKYITAKFRNDRNMAEIYWNKLERVLVEHDIGFHIVPKLYRYPESELDKFNASSISLECESAYSFEYRDELLTPVKSNIMETLSEAKPFLWAQSLYLIAQLLRDDLLTPNELDPLGLHLSGSSQVQYVPARLVHRVFSYDDAVIQIALISENSRLQSMLATYGIPTQTAKQIEPLTLNSPGDLLIKVYSYLGENKKLGLSGRPLRPIGAIGTSKVYQIFGRLAVFYPTDVNFTDFYMSYDIKLYIDTIKSIIRFLNSYWNLSGRPTVTLLLDQNFFKGGYFKDMISFLAQLRGGEISGIKVRLDRLQALIPMSCVEVLECFSENEAEEIKSSICKSPRLRSRSSSTSLTASNSCISLDVDDTFIDEFLQPFHPENTADSLAEEPDFGIFDTRRHSIERLEGLYKNESNLLGKMYVLHEIINKAGPDHQIDRLKVIEHLQDVYDAAGNNKHWKAVRLGASLLRKVVDCLAPSLTHMLVKEKEVSIGVFGYPEHIITEPLTPPEIADIIYKQCTPYEPIEAVLQQELMLYLGDLITRSDMNNVFKGMVCFRFGWLIQAMKNELHRKGSKKHLYQMSPYDVKLLLQNTLLEDSKRTALYQRQLNGALNRVPPKFYSKVYNILMRTPGGIELRGRKLPQFPTIRVMSGHERAFFKEVEKLLSDITNPEYRQLVVELMMVISTVLERNTELTYKNSIDLDKLLLDAFKSLDDDIKDNKIPHLKDHQDPFYCLPLSGLFSTVTYMGSAVMKQLLQDGVEYDTNETCTIS